MHLKTVLSSLVRTCLVLLVVGVSGACLVKPVQAQVFEDITQNFSDDTSGNVGRLNFFDPVYGNSNTNAENARIVVPLVVPDTSTGPRLVKKVTIEMHDHDESLVFDLRLNQNTLPNLLANIDIKTANGARCNDLDFKTRINNHHLPQNAAQDADCYISHTFDINQPVTSVLLNISRKGGSGATSTEQHVHIRNVTWTVEKKETQQPIPDPQLTVLSCVDPTATQQLGDILRVTWPTPAIPITTVAISDSQAANRWESPAGRFWSKETRGATTITAPAAFWPRTPTTPNPLVFKPNTPYSIVLWDGARLSNPKDVTFQACAPTTPASASLTNACIMRESTEPLAYTLTLNNIDTKGAAFTKATFYLSLEWSIPSASLRNYLGTPSWSDWEKNNRLPQMGDRFGYIIGSTTNLSANTITFTWDNTQLIGGTRGNQRTLADLAAWVQATGAPQTYTVAAQIQTTASGNIVTSDPASTTTLQISPQACLKTVACVPNCNSCSLDQSPNGCNGFCSLGSSRGTPNAAELLVPAPGESLVVSENIATISWRQTAANTPSAAYVDSYQVLLYDSDHYSSPQAALTAAQQQAGDVVFFYKPAAQAYPNNIYIQQVTLPPGLLSSTKVSIAVRSLNLTCPGSTEIISTPNNPNIPTNPNNPPDSPWEVEVDIPLEARFAGKFYKGDSCNIAATEPVALSGSSTVTIQNLGSGQETTGNANGTGYAIPVPAQSTQYSAKLRLVQTGTTDTLVCSHACNPADSQGNCILPSTTGPTNTANFFLKSYNLNFGSWWQTKGGLVYGHTGIRSDLPIVDGTKVRNSDCEKTGEYCQPFLIRRLFDTDERSAGIAYTGGSFSSKIEEWWTHRTDRAHADTGVDAKTKLKQENYAYFWGQLSHEISPDITKNITSLGDIPQGREDKGAKVSYRDGDLLISPDQTWTVPAGEKRVIFVKGNLTFSQIPDKIISVQPGGFLAFIVSGDITFDASVGYTNPSETEANTATEPNIEGVFIANGVIRVRGVGDDKKFIGAGSFVGWDGVELQRSFDNGPLGKARNNTTPTETFIYRPDFLLSAPDSIKESEMTWREVN